MSKPAASIPLIRRFWREHLFEQKKRLGLAVLFTIGLAGITALYPIIIQQSFDKFGRGDTSVLWMLPPLIILVTSLRGGFMYLQQVTMQALMVVAPAGWRSLGWENHASTADPVR